MPRKESAVLDYKLRIREALRRRLAQAAEKRGVSLNAEMVRRLEESFDQERIRSLEEVTQRLEIVAKDFTTGAPIIGAPTLTQNPAGRQSKEKQK